MEDSNNEFQLNSTNPTYQSNDDRGSEEQQQLGLIQEDLLFYNNTQPLDNNHLFNITRGFLDQQLFNATEFNSQHLQQQNLQFNNISYAQQLPGTSYKNDTYAFDYSGIQPQSFDGMSFPMNDMSLTSQVQGQQPRQEKDLFEELITLATDNNPPIQNKQHIWQFQPSSSSMNRCPDNTTNRIYQLDVVQQPSRARMCGFGDKDRRPISPAPILKLTVKTLDGQVINPDMFDISFLIVACDSCPMNTQREEPATMKFTFSANQIINFSTRELDKEGREMNTSLRMRNLVGSLVSSASKLYDLDGNLGIFFVFPDISIRSEGTYKLKFSLIDIGSPYSHKLNTTSVSKVLKIIETDPFSVYTPKKFPGVVKTTPLSICFSRQGIKIPNRQAKNKSKKTIKNSKLTENNSISAEDEDEDDEV